MTSLHICPQSTSSLSLKQPALAFIAVLCLAQGPDWTGNYESRGHVIVVTKADLGYDCQWYDGQGVLAWYGQLRRDDVGRWIETYPPDLSPRSCSPWEWETDKAGRPTRVVRDGSIWELTKGE